VVVIDEAHNLIDTLNEMHTITATARQLSEASAQLAQYAERYQARLKPTNRMFIQQLLYVVRALRRALTPPPPPPAAAAATAATASAPPVATVAAPPAASVAPTPAAAASEKLLGLNAFLSSLNIDNINLFRLRAFCHAAELSKKLRGFVDSESVRAQSHAAYSRAVRRGGAATAAAPSGGGEASAAANSLNAVLQLLEALTNSDADGRVLVHIEPRPPPPAAPPRPAAAPAAAPAPAALGGAAAAAGLERRPESFVRVLHLNPAVYFASVLEEAHAVVLAGGTMQ
jgi:chromosome transmission fidelity protein 1